MTKLTFPSSSAVLIGKSQHANMLSQGRKHVNKKHVGIVIMSMLAC